MSEVREKVKTLLMERKKLQAIKEYREATSLGLKESKEAVEAIEAEMRSTGQLPPDKTGRGCGVQVSLFLVLLILALLTKQAAIAIGSSI